MASDLAFLIEAIYIKIRFKQVDNVLRKQLHRAMI